MIKHERFFNSFRHALSGFRFALQLDQNLRVHLIIAAVIIMISVWLGLSSIEVSIIIAIISIVITAEMLNTAIEKTVDLITKDYRLEAKIAKDVSSAMVLSAALGSVAVGVIIFYPYIFKLIF